MRPCISVSGLWEALWEEASATSHVSEPCEMQMAMVLYGPRRLGRPARDGIGDTRPAWSNRTRFKHLGGAMGQAARLIGFANRYGPHAPTGRARDQSPV